MPRHNTRPIIVKGQTATIETYPPVVGVPSSCTARYGTPSTAMPSSATSITPDSTSTSIAATASQGDVKITISSLAGVSTPRRYLLGLGIGGVAAGVGNDQPYIDVEVLPHANLTVSAADLAEPLPCGAPNSSPLLGWRMTVDLTTNDTATLGPGVVEWTATVLGVVHKWTTAFRIVERDGTYTLTPTVLTSSSPYCKLNRPENDTDYTELIDAAWRRFVEPDLLGKALRPERIVHGPHFEAAHIAACEYFLSIEFEDDAQRRADRKANLANAIEKVLHASDLWIVSEVEDLSNANPNELGLTGTAAGQMPIGTYPDGSVMYGTNDFDTCHVWR